MYSITVKAAFAVVLTASASMAQELNLPLTGFQLVPAEPTVNFQITRDPLELAPVLNNQVTNVESALRGATTEQLRAQTLQTQRLRNLTIQDMRVALGAPQFGNVGLVQEWDSLDVRRRDDVFGDAMLGTMIDRFDEVPETTKMVRPGSEIEGIGGAQGCTGGCSAEPMVIPGSEINSDGTHRGPICPEFLCPGVTLAGCWVGVDSFCHFPERQALPLRGDGRTSVSYRKDGYPEVVFLSLESLQSETAPNFQTCSGTLLSPTQVLTAFHCITTSSNFLPRIYDPQEGDVSGWIKLIPKETDKIALMAYSDATGTAGLVNAVHVPVAAFGNIYFTPNAGDAPQPRSDIVLLDLAPPGIALLPHQFPKLDFTYGPQAEAISFSGFGWSNYKGLSGEEWAQFSTPEKFRSLKFTSFNFAEAPLDLDGLAHPHLSWKNGDPVGTGGPCLADSGGPIYAGFNRGFWNDPRRVIGVVRGATGSSEVSTVDACQDPQNFGLGEELRLYQDALCALGNGAFRGCG